jgi:hypothetical protein
MGNLNRWSEISFIEDVKVLNKTLNLIEYYDKANQGLFEFINPSLSYDYEELNMGNNQKMWKVKKQNNDPQFLVTLKNSNEWGDDWLILDFYFFETGFDKQLGLEGKHYLDTLSKILKDDIIPYFLSSSKNILYFNAHSGDGGGETRKKVFEKMINKFIDKNKLNVEIKNQDFIIKKVE